MSRSSIGNRREARLAVSDKFKQKEDVKLRTQLPDYGDFQGYDLGSGDALHQVLRQIYANFHKPSWQTLKHHLFPVGIAKKLVREIKAIAGNGKKAISNKNGCLAE